MTTTELKSALLAGEFDDRLTALYGAGNTEAQRARYATLADFFLETYGDREGSRFYSVPGRSEISGNHTDHNHGKVLAASIDLDIIAVAAAADDNYVHITSVGFNPDDVDLTRIDDYRADRMHSASLVAGTADGLRKRGYTAGGLVACTTSNVLKGSGLSSSAAFEDMCVNLQNHLYNEGKIGAVELAQISQYAENEFFGKPCGLMDQIACAAGGFVYIDFADPSSPVVEKLPFDLGAHGYSLCIVDTGGNHADLTDDYASVPREMKKVASALGCEYLRLTSRERVIAEAAKLRSECGDRALLRALHFFAENDRVTAQAEALRLGDIDRFFELVRLSGNSSVSFLQNVYTTKNVEEQGLTLALALASGFLTDKGGAWRVHGGGFAGTIQAYVRDRDVDGFRKLMEGVFGEGSVYVLHVRAEGATKL